MTGCVNIRLMLFHPQFRLRRIEFAAHHKRGVVRSVISPIEGADIVERSGHEIAGRTDDIMRVGMAGREDEAARRHHHGQEHRTEEDDRAHVD